MTTITSHVFWLYEYAFALAQQRPILNFLTNACRAHCYQLTPSSLLPLAESQTLA